MNAGQCCQTESPARGNARRPMLRRSGEIAGWIVPGALLTLLPKCPACFAAYIALATGVGISIATATYVRFSLSMFCVGLLVYLAVKRIQALIGL